MMIKLEFAELDRKPIWILDKPVHIGSDKHNQLAIRDPSLSPRHATISLENGNYMLKDLGSGTGTYIMGQRISQRSIKNGDRIRLGNVELDVIDVLEDSAQLETWTLIACSSQIGGQEYPLVPKTGHRSIKVGRADHCDLIIPETHLSREHALLELEADGIRITDLSSAAGTYINDQRITNELARSGDRIRFDIYNFVLIGPAGAESTEEAVPDDRNEEIPAQSPAPPISFNDEARAGDDASEDDAPEAAAVNAEAVEDQYVQPEMNATPEIVAEAFIQPDAVEPDAVEEAPRKSSILPIVIVGSLASAAIAAAVFLLP